MLTPYSERMQKLLKNATRYYSPRLRPSGHDISVSFSKANGGAIPPNLLQIPNTESNSQYLRYCKIVNTKGHPARFPTKLPEFFIRFLTDPGDTVMDIFAGSNATGQAAERNRRNWVAFETDRRYLAESALRFVKTERLDDIKALYEKLIDPATCGVELDSIQQEMW